MSAKLQYSSRDENPDLHKQTGCMNGIFHLFDRNHFLAGRRFSAHRQKRLPPGPTSNYGRGSNYVIHNAEERSPEDLKEKLTSSVDSSRTSLSSSSCSTTFSSVDCNKSSHPEPSFLTHGIFPGTPTQMLSKRQPNSSFQVSQKSLDLRDVVKDSIYREPYGFSVNTTMKEGGISLKETCADLPVNAGLAEKHVKHIDSPRPLQVSKSVKPKVSSLDKQLPLPAKLPGAPRSSNVEKALVLSPKDPPRFSYDESRDKWRSSMKLKEFPRLSLDSREQSIRSASESRSNYLLDDLRRRNGKSNQALHDIEEPGSNKRPSSVVAKLMGLEALPDSMSTNNDAKITCRQDEDLDVMSTSSRKAVEIRHHQVSRSPRTPQREHASSQLININSAIKLNSRFPLEPAPWKQSDGNRGPQKPSFTNQEAHTKTPNSCPSISVETEKRLTGLEFKRSGKDLKALKQILEAMEKTREKLEIKKEWQASDLEPQTSHHGPTFYNLVQNSISAVPGSHQKIHPITPMSKGTGPPQKFESSIAAIKPAKAVKKPRNLGSPEMSTEGISGLRKIRISNQADHRQNLVDKRTAKDLIPRNNHFREPSCQAFHSLDKGNNSNSRTNSSTDPIKASHQKMGGNPINSERGTTTGSPRLPQKKHEIGKLSCPTTQTSDSCRANGHLSKQQTQSSSPRRQFKQKSSNLQQGELSKIISQKKCLSQQGDTSPEQSESNISSARSESNLNSVSQIDIEVTSIYHPKEMNGAYLLKDQKNEVNFLSTQIGARLMEDDRSKAEILMTSEQPSPVSVLDNTFYREESPSPVKKKSTVFRDEEILNYDEAEWNLVDLELLMSGTGLNHGPTFDQEILVTSTHDEAAADHIASLCESTHPDHRYITQILLASGLLLKGLDASSTFIELPQSGYLINPNLYLALEQRNGGELPLDAHGKGRRDQSKLSDKIHRKLIFDTVNEILFHKLTSPSFSEPWIFTDKLGARSLTGKQLLKELCSDIDSLQANPEGSLHVEGDNLISILSEDIISQTQNWTDYHFEIPGMVLEIERLIFKDLISEVASGEAAGLPHQSTRQCRRLFSK
ncbi:hypothetical protein NMG60_11006334 [Bertholletia excelsa]